MCKKECNKFCYKFKVSKFITLGNKFRPKIANSVTKITIFLHIAREFNPIASRVKRVLGKKVPFELKP